MDNQKFIEKVAEHLPIKKVDDNYVLDGSKDFGEGMEFTVYADKGRFFNQLRDYIDSLYIEHLPLHEAFEKLNEYQKMLCTIMTKLSWVEYEPYVENLHDVSKIFTSNLADKKEIKAVFHSIEENILKYSLEIAGILIPLETTISYPCIPEDFSIEKSLQEFRENYVQKHNPKSVEDFFELEEACHYERWDIEFRIERIKEMTLEERIMETTFKLTLINRAIRLSEIYGCIRNQIGEEITDYDFCSCGGIYRPVWDNAPDLASFCSQSGPGCPDKRNRCTTD